MAIENSKKYGIGAAIQKSIVYKAGYISKQLLSSIVFLMPSFGSAS